MAYRTFVFPLTDKGFSRWCFEVRISRSFVSTYNKQSAIYHDYNEEEYLARRKLIRQCEILKLELTKGECLLLEKRIGMKRDAVPKNEDVVARVTVKRKWREIERNAIEALFESVDIPELLKNGREACGFSRAEASAFFHISQRTLKNYEEGKRLSKADVLLKALLVYGYDKIF